MHDGSSARRAGQPFELVGMPYDRPVVGYGGKTINTLGCGRAAAPDYFDFREFSSGDFVGALAETLAAESLTRVLYPDDSTDMGQGLRFVQEYFLVACSLADLVRRFRRGNPDWSQLPDKVAIQLNDTHPALAVPELMRILLDEAQLGWDEAWDMTAADPRLHQPHAAARGAGEMAGRAGSSDCCRATWRSSTRSTGASSTTCERRFPGDEARVERMSLIEEGPERKVRMANLAIVGSHSTNGVAAIHSELLRTTTVKDFAEMFPERFNNKTNGVTPRRWLLLANPSSPARSPRPSATAGSPTSSQAAQAQAACRRGQLPRRVPPGQARRQGAFRRLAENRTGQMVDPDSIFDCQIKRIHEYKRQLLNALRIVVLYNRLRENPDLEMTPRTFFFAGKAAPAYQLAKLIIKFINNLAGTIDGDPVDARPAQGRVPAGVLRVAGRAADPGQPMSPTRSRRPATRPAAPAT